MTLLKLMDEIGATPPPRLSEAQVKASIERIAGKKPSTAP
jgi:hypothetical protein